MILELFIPLVALGIIMIIIGIMWSSHTEFAIIGFVFLIFLSLTLMNGQVEYRTGSNQTAKLYYNGTTVSQINQTTSYDYRLWNDVDSQQYGQYLLFGSMLGCAVMFFLVGRTFF